ncbi:AtpZ/AtpI family protein [Geminicoccaceae bacterium 1502E]|nr:AtpZ/AtpI family protein [Geminicoccaceae bacterium 1502E]
MTQDDRPPPFSDFDARLKRLRAGEKGAADEEKEGARSPLNFGSGLQAGIEMIAGVAGGLLLGWALDAWLGTRPLFLIVFFVLGAGAGMLNAFRSLRRLSAEGSKKDPDA